MNHANAQQQKESVTGNPGCRILSETPGMSGDGSRWDPARIILSRYARPCRGRSGHWNFFGAGRGSSRGDG